MPRDADPITGADDLVELIRTYNPKTDESLLKAAYAFGEEMHAGQVRHSGEPYFTHPVAVAAILAQQQLDDATIITALLHDTIEDTRASYNIVAEKFGSEIADLVDGVTKLTNLQLSSTETQQAENFRKLFMAMSKDMRVILVKLADRLHNMRTIKAMRPEKQLKKARETMDIFAPLAGRMGMQWMREELEDLAFRVINPEARASIMRRFITLQREAGDVIERITGDMRHELDKAGIEAEILGRAKKPYSIWRKMQETEMGFSRLSDIYAFRLITGSEEDCYRVLGVIHRRWRAVPGRFKDYISQPKSNGYRSIHTTVSGRDGKLVEVQVRTRQMHEVAETGVAAHWSYRDGVRAENPFAVDPARWIATLTERFDTEDDHDEFLEHVKLEMYQDQVFCFTPKGEVVKLPRGATPLDFAYAIHTRIGDSCVGAKAAIRRSLREEDKERFMKLGRELARVAFDKIDKKATDKALSTAAKQMGLEDRKDLLARIGAAEIAARDVIRTLYPELEAKSGDEIDAARAVVGLKPSQTFRRAHCCQPVPGERIVGISYRGKGVMTHAIDCPALIDVEDQPNRWVDLHWQEGKHPAVHTVSLDVTIANDAGVLGRICTLIGEQKANISDLVFLDRKPDFYRLIIDADLRDVEHLHAVMLALEADSDVASISRHRDLDRKP